MEEILISLQCLFCAGVSGFSISTETLNFATKIPDSYNRLIVVHWSWSFVSKGQLAAFDIKVKVASLILSFYFIFWRCGM